MSTAVASPFTVPSAVGGRVQLVVMGADDPLPPAVTSYALQSPKPFGLRIAGGCAGMSADDKSSMLRYFGAGLSGFSGLVSSGGTRSVTEHGTLDPMVTDVPAVLVSQSPERIAAISTLPRTDGMGLVEESRLVLSEDGQTVPNPGVHMIVVVQSNMGTPLDWDGDLDVYFSFFQTLVQRAAWQFGMVVYNGGGVTRKEVLQAAALGWPIIVVDGSGRQANIIADEVRSRRLELPGGRRFERGQFTVVNNGDPVELHEALVAHGLIAV